MRLVKSLSSRVLDSQLREPGFKPQSWQASRCECELLASSSFFKTKINLTVRWSIDTNPLLGLHAKL